MENRNAFTLVELIVVITILAILGTIAFISLQGYSMDARDTKRISDVRSLLSKISVEQTKGMPYAEMVSPTPGTGGLQTNNLTINGTGAIGHQGIANFGTLGETQTSFQDPKNSQDYPLAYAEGITGTEPNEIGYKFVEMATVSEKRGTAIIMGNYYEMQPGDSPSLFINEDGEEVKNGTGVLPYNPGVNPPVAGGNTPGGSSSGGELADVYCTFDDPGDAGKFDTCKFQ